MAQAGAISAEEGTNEALGNGIAPDPAVDMANEKMVAGPWPRQTTNRSGAGPHPSLPTSALHPQQRSHVTRDHALTTAHLHEAILKGQL